MRDEDQPLYAALAERLRAAGLARVVDELLALARPAISLAPVRVDEGAIAVGAGKLGGTADLPPGAVWPEWRGTPLPFIAQIRLEEVAPLDPEGDLPHQGLLSFFFTEDEPASSQRLDVDPAWRVLYAEDLSALERRPTPTAPLGKLGGSFPACVITPKRRLTLPPDVNQLAAIMGLSNDERTGLIGIVIGEFIDFDELMDHHLLGYPYVLNNAPTFLEPALARHGVVWPNGIRSKSEFERFKRVMAAMRGAENAWRSAGNTHPGPDALAMVLAAYQERVYMEPAIRALDDSQRTALPGHVARLVAQGATPYADWRLLLQIYSNEEAEMDWGGGGVLHVKIASTNLAARDFSGVWMAIDLV
jgi:hypothetical protein